MIEALAIELVTLHMVDGRPVQVNPAQVTQVLPTNEGNSALIEDVNCVIRLTDGSYLSVVETCVEVGQALEGAKQ